jgi:hypothetical protein
MISLPIPETVESVTRPVMLDVVRQLMTLTGISKKTNIVYFGDLERSKQLNSAIGASDEKDDPNTFAHNDKISIEVAETYFNELGHQDAVERPENLLVFQDAPLSIVMKPIYAQMEATVSIRFRANNKTLAMQWRDFVKARLTQSFKRELYLHNVTYSFGIPEECLYILKELHRLRENVAGFGEDFDTYFANHRTPKMTTVRNLSATAQLWSVPETQTRIQGWFDWELPEEAQKDADGTTYTVAFNYKFRYARPTRIEMIYPIMVHNQLLDAKYRDTPLTDPSDVEKSYAMTARIFRSFEGGQWDCKQIQDFGFSIPAFDEFWPKMVPNDTRRLLTVLFTLDDTNPHQFLNLGDLKSRQLHPDILEYIRSEREYLTVPGLSAIHLALYKNEFLIANNPAPFNVDADLNVVGLLSTNLRVQHHLRISLFTDWQSLRGGALQRMQDHGRAAILMLMAIDPSLKDRGLLPVLIDDNFVSKTSLLIAINNLRPTKNILTPGPTGMMYTVQSMFQETFAVE